VNYLTKVLYQININKTMTSKEDITVASEQGCELFDEIFEPDKSH
jgi:hypothetical protein